MLTGGTAASEAFASAALHFFGQQQPGVSIRHQFRDTDPLGCAENARNALEDDVSVIIGPVISSCALSILSEIGSSDVPILPISGSSRVLSDPSRFPTLFRAVVTSEVVATNLLLMLEATQFECAVFLTDGSLEAVQETASAFISMAAVSTVNISLVATFDDSMTTLELQDMLYGVWRHGVGIIVLNS